jgi:hypothetical protein
MYKIDTRLTLHAETVTVLREIITVSQRAQQELVAGFIYSAGKWVCQHSSSVVSCRHFHEKCLLRELLEICILCS